MIPKNLLISGIISFVLLFFGCKDTTNSSNFLRFSRKNEKTAHPALHSPTLLSYSPSVVAVFFVPFPSTFLYILRQMTNEASAKAMLASVLPCKEE